MKTIETELKLMYQKLNIQIFHGTLSTPQIIIKQNKKIGKNWSYINTSRGSIIKVHCEKLVEPINLFVLELLHQMVHHYCTMHDISDTTKERRYHNIRYKRAAQKHGIIMGKGKDGYYNIGLTQNVTDLIDQLQIHYERIHNTAIIQIALRKEIEQEREELRKEMEKLNIFPRSSINPYKSFICPSCKYKVYACESARIICGWCGSEYIRE